jgi:hypothetical protein
MALIFLPCAHEKPNAMPSMQVRFHLSDGCIDDLS